MIPPAAPQRAAAFCAFDPAGKPDIDTMRRNQASCHSAVSNMLGVPWLECVRRGWAVRAVTIVPSGQVEEELDRPALVTPIAVLAEIARLVPHAPKPPRRTFAQGVISLMRCGGDG